jgi:hypothetical protein
VSIAKRRIVKAPKAKMSPCPVCGDVRGPCVSGGVTFVPEQWWSRRNTRRRSPSK